MTNSVFEAIKLTIAEAEGAQMPSREIFSGVALAFGHALERYVDPQAAAQFMWREAQAVSKRAGEAALSAADRNAELAALHDGARLWLAERLAAGVSVPVVLTAMLCAAVEFAIAEKGTQSAADWLRKQAALTEGLNP